MKTRNLGIPNIIQFKRLLKDRGLKATPQRTAVHEAMRALVHASAEDVSAYIAAQGDTRISPASVYNILSMLADLRIYSLRCGRAGKMVFDVRTGPHVHLYDTQGQAWRDIEDPELLTWMEEHFRGRRFRGFKLDGVDVQLLCHPTRKAGSLK